MSTVGENAQTVVLLEATAEARTLIEDATRLAEDLKVRQGRLGELLAPSEAALRARTEYLDKVMRDELSRAEQRVLKLAEEVETIARHLIDQIAQMPAGLAEADARRWRAREARERWGMLVGLLAMLIGGFLAGQVTNWRSGAMTNPQPPSVEERTSTPKSPPIAPRRAVGPSAKPNAAPAR
jgi:hypothetical protein